MRCAEIPIEKACKGSCAGHAGALFSQNKLDKAAFDWLVNREQRQRNGIDEDKDEERDEDIKIKNERKGRQASEVLDREHLEWWRTTGSANSEIRTEKNSAKHELGAI
mgnify:CR=1 FL=1